MTHNQYFIYIASEAHNEGAFTRLHNHLKGGKSEIAETHSLSNYCFSHKGPHEDWILCVLIMFKAQGMVSRHTVFIKHKHATLGCVCVYVYACACMHAFVHSWVCHRDRNRGKVRLLQEGYTAPRGDWIHSGNLELTPSLSSVM